MLITGGAGFVDFYATGYYTKRREEACCLITYQKGFSINALRWA
jgi:hypothetical protein